MPRAAAGMATASAATVLFVPDPLVFSYRSKTTLKLFLDKNEKTKAYSYEISNIEILRGTAESLTQPNCKISMPTVESLTGTARIVILPNTKTSIDVGILLNGVCDVNGAPLLAG